MNIKESLPFLFLVGLLLFNWPFLEIFQRSLPYYLFGAWFMIIMVIGLFASRKKD